jgi:glycosyltransferase involved in cell wall biosynthesis
MKINLIIPSFYPATIYGGPIFSTLHTTEELAKLGNIKMYVSTTNSNMHSKLDVKTNENIKFDENFYVRYYNETIVDKFSLPFIFNISKDIKNADIVHIQAIFNIPIPISLFFAKLYKKPIILTPRGSFGGWCLDQGSKYKNLWLKLLIKPFVKNIIWHATAEEEKNDILNLFPNSEVKIIPNGIEYNKFQNSNTLSKREYSKKFINQDIEPNKIIVSMGRLQKKKGFDILIDSFYETLKSFPNSILLIAGGDEGEEENLKNQIKSLNLQNNVFLIGAIKGQDKIDFLANADLFCLPSHNENFGNVYTESLAAGTPIVASINTPWEEVENYDCGKWVKNNIDTTSKAMNEMLQKDREKMRKNSKEFAYKFDWKNIAKDFKKLFEKILDKNAK